MHYIFKKQCKEGVEGMRDKEKYIKVDKKDLLVNSYTAYDITTKCPKCGLNYTEHNSETEEMVYVECDRCGCKYKFIYYPF